MARCWVLAAGGRVGRKRLARGESKGALPQAFARDKPPERRLPVPRSARAGLRRERVRYLHPSQPAARLRRRGSLYRYVRSGTAAPGHRNAAVRRSRRSEEHTSELQSQSNLVCRLLLEKKKKERK